jgi:hypothetical protein
MGYLMEDKRHKQTVNQKEVHNSVTCISLARQRVGKHILATRTHATIGRLL